jgi:hypothetical protein
MQLCPISKSRFTSQLSGIEAVGGNWTDATGANIGNITAAQITTTVPTPEPGSLILLAAGGALVAALRRRETLSRPSLKEI